MRRSISVSCLLLAALPSAWASSFDLLYLPNNNTNRVIRWDPANQINLGSFGSFGGGGVRYVGIGSNNRAYVTSGAGTTVFNAATGSVITGRGLPSDKISVDPTGTIVYEGFSNLMLRYSPDLVSSGFAFTSLTLNAVLGLSSTTSLGFGVSGSGNLRVQSFLGSSPGSFIDGTATSVIGTRIGASQAVVSGNTARWALSYVSGTTRMFVRGTTDVNTGGTSLADFIMNGGSEFSLTAALLTVPAHNGFWVIGDDASSATLTRISYYSQDASRLFTYTTNAFDVPTDGWGGHIVLAPEPGTMAALAVGVAALVRRRRAAASRS